jgi:hypothetical protein
MTQLVGEVLRLQRAGWIVRRAEAVQTLSAQVLRRYPWVPPEIQSLLCAYVRICRADEKAWLLCAPDFSGTSQSAYRWNEWELQSLEGARCDPSWQQYIQTFWDKHFPIALSIDDGYSYHALRSDGAVVAGREPEYEEARQVAESYAEFLGLNCLAWTSYTAR